MEQYCGDGQDAAHTNHKYVHHIKPLLEKLLPRRWKTKTPS